MLRKTECSGMVLRMRWVLVEISRIYILRMMLQLKKQGIIRRDSVNKIREAGLSIRYMG